MTTWDYFPLCSGPYEEQTGVCGGWWITSYFGGRPDPITGQPDNHGGEDLAYSACYGTPIYAPLSGTLAQSWDPSGGGYWSGVTGDDGSYFGIGHAAEYAPGASYRRVAAGELIAFVGSSGASTGAHAHVAYRPPGSYSYADPYDVLMECCHRFVGDDGMPEPGDDSEESMQAKLAEDESRGARYLVWFTEGLPYRKLWLSTQAQADYWDGFGLEDLGKQGYMLGCLPDLGTPLPVA